MAELSRESGVPVATIKFYLREGVLAAGTRTGPNQADYGADHVRRLAVIRALREVAHLPLATIRRLAAAIDDAGLPIGDLVGEVADALSAPQEPVPSSPGLDRARGDVLGLLQGLGWQVREDAQVVGRLAETLSALRQVFLTGLPAEAFLPYAAAVSEIARVEIGVFAAGGQDRDRAIEQSVVGTVLWERVMTSLRRAAHEHYYAQSLGKAASDESANPQAPR